MLVYEVNLEIENNTYNKHKTWLQAHFHDMVIKNGFLKLQLFQAKNVNPVDDTNMRYTKLIAQYYILDYSILKQYLKDFSEKMRNEIVTKLGTNYNVSRRIFELLEVFKPGEKSE